jgi:hypothetical protein
MLKLVNLYSILFLAVWNLSLFWAVKYCANELLDFKNKNYMTVWLKLLQLTPM